MAENHEDEPGHEPRGGYRASGDWRQREAYENAIARAAEGAVRRALDQVGIEVGGEGGRDLTEDLAHLRRIRIRAQSDEEHQKDQAYLRRSRLRSERKGEAIEQTAWAAVLKVLSYFAMAALGALGMMFGVGRHGP